jgi:excisionase family DNA binding protein
MIYRDMQGRCNMGLDKLPNISTVKQLAEFLQVTELTVRRAINAGELKAFKVGREWRIERKAVMEWLEQK